MMNDGLLPIAFDLRWRAATPEMHRFVNHLTELVLRYSGKRHRKLDQLRLSAEVIVSNLAAVQLAAPGARLAVRRDEKARRYSSIYGRHFVIVLDLLEDLSLIETVQVGFRMDASFRESTSIRALPGFQRALPPTLSWHDLQAEPDDVVILRSAAKRPITISPFSRKAALFREEMDQVNAMLAAASITLDGKEVWIQDHGRFGRIVSTRHHRTVRRIFNNGRFEHGGRLYGGFWEALPRQERALLRLNGTPVVSVDYRQFNLRVAYQLCGVPWPFGREDPYIAGPGSRDGWKVITSVHFWPMGAAVWPGKNRGERDEIRAQFPEGAMPRALHDAVRMKHSRIARVFGSKIGYRLMRVESDLLIASLLELADRGICALPLHDAVLVPVSDAETASTVMSQAAQQLGYTLPVKISPA